MIQFEIKYRDAAGRIGKIKTRHGDITTPTLLPVINPNKMTIKPDEIKELFGAEIVITNSYIIYKKRDLREKALSEGVHNLIDFDGAIMTDSGTFQSYVYGDIDVDFMDIVKFQRDIGSDIGTILDIFTTPDDDYDTAKSNMETTIERAKRSVDLKGNMYLASTIQGGIYPRLREENAKRTSKLDVDLFPIGGVVPLMENQRYRELVECIISTKKGLDPSKPVHLFGAGHPLLFPITVALGVDMVDSAAYAKYAKDRRLIFPWGTEKLDNLEELPCNCPICSKITAKELKKSNKEEQERLIALHNLYISFSEMRRVRESIRKGNLWELVEEKASLNPALFDGLRFLEKEENKKWLERFEPVSKKNALFYTGPHTVHRPVIYRYQMRLLERYKVQASKRAIVVPETDKPYMRYLMDVLKDLDGDLIVLSPIGPVPALLDEMYPIAQSIFPDYTDKDTSELSKKLMDELVRKYDIRISPDKKSGKKRDINMERVAYVIDMQFGKGTADVLLDKDVKIVTSKSTGKIRNVMCNGKHILSMRAHDGFFTLKIDGARKLHEHFPFPRFRVVVTEEAKSFIYEGKNVFSKFVTNCDSDIRPFDECIIVDEHDNLIGVGRTLLNCEEMLSFRYGMAVRTREGSKEIK